jgi:sigma-B regulation protein RsbU (phosphoserine phosphatase)
MEANRTLQNFSKVKSVEPEKVSGELICNKIESSFYITTEHTVDVVAEFFNKELNIQALGVVDGSGSAMGIVTRSDLFALIGQKFGRELYMNRSISEIIKKTEFIYYKRNTFSVIEEVSKELKSAERVYFTLVDAGNNFKGIVSSFDLVLFLSEMMTRELKAARRVHSAIIKDEISISTGSLSVSGSTQMAGETGGDFQYVRRIGDNRIFISLCDVSGKGLNAGLISVAVSSMYAAYDFDKGIDELIRKINSYIYSLFGGEIFLTGIFIDIDESTGTAGIYDMGHSMIYMLKDGKVRGFKSHHDNLPLGIKENIIPSISELRMGSGDFLISYSDGFPEQVSSSGEMFGESRLLTLAMKYKNSALTQVKDILYEELKTWRFGQAQGDDMSLLMIRYN